MYTSRAEQAADRPKQYPKRLAAQMPASAAFWQGALKRKKRRMCVLFLVFGESPRSQKQLIFFLKKCPCGLWIFYLIQRNAQNRD
jgi:hypothetical protein